MNRLACLTNSYHSLQLLKTLADLEIPVHLGNGSIAEELPGLRTIADEDASKLLQCGNLKLYINAEDSLSFIERRSNCDELKRRITFFKNKFEFRNKLKDSFPDFFLRKLSSAHLAELQIPEDRELILKPSLGFHSLGIRRFKGRAQMQKALKEAQAEIRDFNTVFDSSVLSDDVFIVEDFIHGEELACDAFFDNTGKPVINAIYVHAFADENDTRDLLYYTSGAVMSSYLAKMSNFLELIASQTGIRNFPLHIEARISDGAVIPIEANPLRFGGFGLADLAWYAFGINSYRNYFTDTAPDWPEIIGRQDRFIYAFIVGQRPDSFDPTRHMVDHDAYRAGFSNLLEYVPIDAGRYRFFSTAFAATEDLSEFLKYLHMDFGQFRIDIR